MSFFIYLTPITYWILIALWAYILTFYIKRLRGDLREDKLLFVLFVILSIDAFRTLFESCYFGAWYTSLAGFLPMEVHAFLVRPEMVFLPKILNVIAAIAVIFILLYRWVPQEVKAIRKLEQLVDEKTFSLTREIKKRTQAENNVKRYAKNLETIFNSTHNTLALVNAEGRVEMINHRGSEFIKKSNDEVIGLLGGEALNCMNSFGGEGCGRTTNCNKCPIRTKIVDTFESGNNYADEKGQMVFLFNGQERIFHLLISTSILELDGNTKVLLSLTDNTEQILAEKTIWESNQKFEKVFNSHLDSILLLNSENPPKIMEANEATEKIFGYQSNELIGKTTEQLLVDKSHLFTFKETLDSAISNHGYLDDFEFSMRRKDGSDFVSGHRVVELKNDEGNRTGWVSIVRDLTERKQTQEYIQQSQRMEAIGNLAGGIAHDFNNILFPIIGMSELLLEDFSSESSEYEYAQEILTAGNRGSELVKQILSFSRQNKHKMVPVKVQTILEEVHKLTRATISSNIEIVMDIQQNCGAILGDSTQIHQIAMNLITNAYHAIEAANTKGKIMVMLKQVSGVKHGIEKIHLHNGKCLLLAVSDNGSGIKKNIMEKLFEPYFTTKEEGKGTGLGLAVVFGIIKEHGGDIIVQSKENEGTSFNIYLPLMANDCKIESHNEKLSFLEKGTEKILFVDDEEAITRLVKQMLERLGYQVVTYTSSSEALDRFKQNPEFFDLVISDLSMPYMTGEQLTQELLIINPNIPIIICTGFSERIDESFAQSVGIKAFLMKPLVKSDIAKIIRKILDKKIE